MSNTEKVNPHYQPEKLGIIEIFEVQDDDLCYDFNILLFFVHSDGRVFSANDSGCSCPTPFEAYEGTTIDECKLELVTSVSQAVRLYTKWATNGFSRIKASKTEGDVRVFVEKHIKNN
jgi:hypothetical protein